MAKKTETAVDAQELTATPIITIEDVKDAFNEIIEHYYMDASDKIVSGIGEDITDFSADYIKIMADYGDRLKDFYWEIDESQDEDDLRAAMRIGSQTFSDFLYCKEEALRQLLKDLSIQQDIADKVIAIVFNK